MSFFSSFRISPTTFRVKIDFHVFKQNQKKIQVWGEAKVKDAYLGF
jgi:hypothetical protein